MTSTTQTPKSNTTRSLRIRTIVRTVFYAPMILVGVAAYLSVLLTP